jgi:hypothetical protein
MARGGVVNDLIKIYKNITKQGKKALRPQMISMINRKH